MKLRIITPLKIVYEGEIEEIYLPGKDGEFGVLPGHAEMIKMLGTGICRFTENCRDPKKALVSLGLCHVHLDDVEVLTEITEFAGDVDVEKTSARLEELNKKSSSDISENEREYLEVLKKREMARLELKG